MKIPAIIKKEPLLVEARNSKLSKVEFARIPRPALMKEPAHFWDEILIANEAYLLDETTHPRIRQKLAYVATSHQLYLDYVEAVTLQDLVKTGVTLKNPARTHHLLRCVAETLADMHEGILCSRPIVHNDLKSANVLVPAAAPGESLLIDFSHAYFEGSLPPFITDNKQNPAGTAKYMAPEKWEGDFTQGFKGDVFAFGVLAYYTCTGQYPFEGDVARIAGQIREKTPPTPIELGANVPRTSTVIIMSCLEKKPGQRPTMEYVAQCFANTAGLFG